MRQFLVRSIIAGLMFLVPGVLEFANAQMVTTQLGIVQDVQVSPLSDPDVTNARQKARDALREHRYEEAVRFFSEAVEAARRFEPSTDDYIGRINELLATEEYLDALKVAEFAAGEEPDNHRYWHAIGYLNYKLEYYDDARDAFRRALAIDPTHFDSFQHSWAMFESLSDPLAAIGFYEGILEGNDTNELLFHFLGRAYQENGNHEDSVEAFRKAVELNPEDWVNNHNLRLALFQSSDFTIGSNDNAEVFSEFDTTQSDEDKAVATYRAIVGRSRNVVLPRLFFAKALLDAGSEQEALPLIQELLAFEGIELDIRRNIADMLVEIAERSPAEEQVDHYREAAVQYHRVSESSAADLEMQLDAQFAYGKSLIGMRRYIDAIESLEKTLGYWVQVHTTLPSEVYYQLALAHLGNENFVDARIYFRMFELSYGGSTFVTLGHIATIHHRMGEYDEAIPVLRQIIEEATRQGMRRPVFSADELAGYRLMMAECLIKTGKFESAREELERLNDADEVQLRAKLLLAEAFLGDNKIQMAIDELKSLESTDDWSARGMTVMGQTLIAGGDYAAALKYLEQAERDAEPETENQLLQAECHLELGSRDEAVSLFEAILDRDRTIVEAWLGLGDLEMDAARGSKRSQDRIEHLTAAIELFEKAQVEAPTDQRVRARMQDASDEKIAAESNLKASRERTRTAFYAFLVMLGAAIPTAGMIIGYRRQWARRMFKDVLALERDLRNVIRVQVSTQWGGDWDRFRTEDGFAGRIPYRYLEKKKDKQDARDVLEVSNFGHLVAMIDTGWDHLGFEKRAKLGTKELVIAALSYVGTCRNAIAHSHEMQSEMGFGDRNPIQHMNRQVRRSLNTIRSNFDLAALTQPTETHANVPPIPPTPPPPPPIVHAVRVRDP